MSAKPTAPQLALLAEAADKGFVRCAESYAPFKRCIEEGWLLRSGKDSGKGYITEQGRAAYLASPAAPRA